MVINILFNALGILFFLFIFWKKLREDYPADSVYGVGFLMLIGIELFSLISQKYWPEWWFWMTLLGAFLGFILGTWKFKFRFFESLEASIIGLLPWLSLVFLKDSIVSSNLSSLIAFIVLLSMAGFYVFLDSHYKKFTWYKSGKVGFSGLMTLGTLFLIRTAVAAFFPFVISFLGHIDSILSGVISFTSFLLLFNLARQET